jgi:hypothetical protein
LNPPALAQFSALLCRAVERVEDVALADQAVRQKDRRTGSIGGVDKVSWDRREPIAMEKFVDDRIGIGFVRSQGDGIEFLESGFHRI